MITLEQWQLELEKWEGKPYSPGRANVDQGADCIHFVVFHADLITGIDSGPVPVLPTDTALHAPQIVFKLIKELRQRWKNEYIEGDPGIIFPGDIVLTNNGRHPGHLMIAGPEKNVIWHAINERNTRSGRICKSSYGWAKNAGIRAVARLEACEAWRS